MKDNISINKAAIIRNCLKRIKEDYHGFEKELEDNFMRQDAIVLNLQRACEASIDLAIRLIRIKKLGIPQDSRDAFAILEKEGMLNKDLSHKLQNMVGFRNIAVHNYQKVNLHILRSILNEHLEDFELLIQELSNFM